VSRKVRMADDLPAECPKCESDDLCIDNVEGMECMKCGCWFDTEPDGQLVWIRANRPADLDLL
jgi:hypothetical protein